jgi:hypothetical protein
MAAYNKFQDFSEQVLKGVHVFGTHVFKIALTNTAPVATQTTWNTTDHPAPAAANGYTAGGNTTTMTLSETGGTSTVQGTQTTFTAAGGAIGPFRYAVLYNDTATSPADAAVAWFDYGSSVTLNDGESIVVKFNNQATGNVFTLA